MIPLFKPKWIWGLLGTLVVSTALVSCDEMNTESKKLGVSPKEITIPAQGGSATVSFTAVKEWKVSSSAEWLAFNPPSGGAGDIILTVEAQPNPGEADRTAVVTVALAEGDYSESFQVKQQGQQPVAITFTLSEASVSFEYQGGEKKLSLTASQAWTASADADWIGVAPLSGEGDAEVVITVPENKELQGRSGVVTFVCGEKTLTLPVEQKAATMAEVSGFRATIESWSDGGSITLPGGSGAPVTPQEWSIYLPATEEYIPMTQGENGLYTASVPSHYDTMPMFFARGSADKPLCFGSVYKSAFVPKGDGTYPVSLVYTSELAYAVYVPINSAIDATLDPVALQASFQEVAVNWESLGKGKFTDGFISYLFGLTPEEVDVEIESNPAVKGLYRILNPYPTYGPLFDAYYVEDAALEFMVKEDGKAYFRESFTGLYLEEYGEVWAMSLVPECGWDYEYYGEWDQAHSCAIFRQPAAVYLSKMGYYYSNQNSDGMMVILPGGSNPNK